MSNKRFILFKGTTTNDSELICGFKDIQTDKYYYTKSPKDAKEIIALLEELCDEDYD